MADTVDGDHNAAFWLPTHFLTDDDFLDHRPPKEPKTFDLFSGGFDPFFGPLSALDSPMSSSETETEPEKDHHDDDFLAELTRQLAHSTLRDTSEKPRLFSTSPQSTLTGFGAWSGRSGLSSNGSPNGPSQVPSPPVTPPGTKNDVAWELLYEAAGQVARLKMNAIAAAQMNQTQKNRGKLVENPRNPSMPSKSNDIKSFYDFPRTNQFQRMRKQGSTIWGQERDEWYGQHHQPRRGCAGAGALELPACAWPPLGVQPHQRHQQGGGPPTAMRPAFLRASHLGSGTGPGIKKSAGTGVFLPRRPGTEPPVEPRRKPSGGSPVLIPARVAQALKLDLEVINNGVNLNSQPRFGCGYVTDHELLMARRNTVVGQQMNLRRRDGSHEVCLPRDWTY